MRKKRKKQVEKVSPEQQQKKIRRWFAKAKDNRASNVQHKISDVLMSGYAMFSLKYSSLHQFEQQTPAERENLKKVYGVEKLCSDAQMRRILDEQCPEYSKRYFRLTYEELKKEKVLKSYQYYKGYIPLAWDGVHHFSSKKVNCDHCTKKEHKTGETTYSHSMLCAAIVCPGKSEVFVVGAEPIRCEDGATKNDCEQNASKRLMSWMSDVYKDEPLLFLEDALYSKGPNIREILANPNWAFVLNIKPEGNKSLFVPKHPRAKKHRIEENGVLLDFEYINNLPLNNSQGDLRVNVLHLTQTDRKGKVTKFSWVTNLKLTPKSLLSIMHLGRSRWKIENETFNTLKNQGAALQHAQSPFRLQSLLC